MMDFIKRQKIMFYLSAVAVVLTLVGIITLGVSNSVQGYALSDGGMLIAFGIISLLLIAAGAYLNDRFGSFHWITTAVYVVAVVLLAICFGFVLAGRVDLAASLFSYDSVNKVGWSAFTPSVVSMVTFLVSAICLAVGAFFKQDAKN